MFLCMHCTPFANRCLIYMYSGWAFEITHLAYTNYHHLITAVSVIKKLTLHEFILWGRDFYWPLSVLERVRIMEGFLKRKYMIILSVH